MICNNGDFYLRNWHCWDGGEIDFEIEKVSKHGYSLPNIQLNFQWPKETVVVHEIVNHDNNRVT